MAKHRDLNDEELFYSVGSHRPYSGGLGSLINGEGDIERQQREFDAAVAEMRRREKERGFPFDIPR